MKAHDAFGRVILVGDKVGIIYQCNSFVKIVRGTVTEVKTTTASGKPRKKPEVVVRTGRYGVMTCKEVRNRIVKKGD